nr:protein kinase superfamily protein with octicosapeptide/Phox/Bem1p domain [Tanacetum cinerariifolium]
MEKSSHQKLKQKLVESKIGDHGISKVKEHNVVSGDVREALPRMAPEPFRGKSHLVTDKIRDLGLLKVNEHTVVSGGVRGALPSMAPDPFRGKSRLVTDKHLVFCFPVEL